MIFMILWHPAIVRRIMDFINGAELLRVCNENSISISEAMKLRERAIADDDTTIEKMRYSLSIMKNAVKKPLTHPEKSMSGLTGGEAKKIYDNFQTGKSILGSLAEKAIAYSMAVLEVNASMGVIVAAPTAGSSGVLPGVLLSYAEENDLNDDEILTGLFNASAIGYLLMRNASVAGAEAGCQAEIGAASAMAASAITELRGGTPSQCLEAAAMTLANMLGLVCDPICGLVEIPCQSRNASGAMNALISAEIITSGVHFMIPFDEMSDAMLSVGKSLPLSLRETAMGGCAVTPAGCKAAKMFYEKNN
jgi:L-serine dehydratase